MVAALHCGHLPSPHGPHTTGTASTADGRVICWECAYEMERADLKTAHRFTAYLSKDEEGRAWYVTTWTGHRLMRVVSIYRGRRFTWGGYQRCYYFRARDVHGHVWTGQGEGEGIYCTLRRRAPKEV